MARHVTVNMPHCTCLDFMKVSSRASWKKKRNECIANILNMLFDFYVTWIMIMTSSFMLQHLPTTKSCDFMNLPMLWCVSNVPSNVFNHMFEKACK